MRLLMEFTRAQWKIAHEWNWRGKRGWDYELLAKCGRQWDQHGHRRPSRYLPSLGEHCLDHYILLWLDYFIVKAAAQSLSMFLISSRILSWTLLYYLVLPRATHFPCAICSKNRMFLIWKSIWQSRYFPFDLLPQRFVKTHSLFSSWAAEFNRLPQLFSCSWL